MKRRINLKLAAAKQGVLAAGAVLLLGIVATAFFALALIGVLVSPDIVGNLPPAVITALLLAGSILLLRRGMAGLKRHRAGKPWAEDSVVPTDVVKAAAMVAGDENPTPQQMIKCEGCGAIGAGDENGCCEYCGRRLDGLDG